MALPLKTRPSFPHSQSLPSRRLHKLLNLVLHKADRMKTTITENSSNWSHRPQPCLTQWNYKPCYVKPPKVDGSGREFWQNVVHWRMKWQTTSVFLPWKPHDSMKRQKDMTLKDKFRRLVGAQYGAGEEWRNNSRKNEETESKWKCSVVDVTGDEIKSDVVKSNIA